jgi:hypothetical protein
MIGENQEQALGPSPNSLSGGDGELDEVPAMADPAHMVQVGRTAVCPLATASGVRPSNDAWRRAAL